MGGVWTWMRFNNLLTLKFGTENQSLRYQKNAVIKLTP